MAKTPTTSEINEIIIAQLEASLNQKIPLLPQSFLRVLAKVMAAVFMTIYKYAGFMFLQMFVQTATLDETEINGQTISPLTLWGRLTGAGDPGSATQAEMIINVTVENQIGSLASGTQLLNSANGITYITIGEVLLNLPVVQATIRAVGDQSGGNGAGAIGNLDPGAEVTFASPVPHVSRTAIVNSQTVTGANAETTAAYRQRIIDIFQKRPQGGAPADYELWAEETPGIINAYPYTSSFPGQVDVYCEATVESSGNSDGIPTTAQLEAVLANINYNESGRATRRPSGAIANTFAISRTAFDVEVTGLQVSDTAGVQQSIQEGIEEYFLANEPYIQGLSTLPRKDIIANTAVGGLVEDIVSAAGGLFTGVIVKEGVVVITQRALLIGEKSKLGNLTFTP